MNVALADRIGAALNRSLPDAVRAMALHLAGTPHAEAVLFYGSNLRTGSLDGVLDFYVLTSGRRERGPWPRVAWIERSVEGHTLRAKCATMTLTTFDRAARGRLLDTTIWARFVQPVALAWVRDAMARKLVVDALAAAAATAGTLAAAVGPERGDERDFWNALFRATYAAELRVERPGREQAIIAAAFAHFDGLLPMAWTAAGIAFEQDGDGFRPILSPARRMAIGRWWRARRRAGKPLNLLRLARATTTFAGAEGYAAWKIERHTGRAVTLPAAARRHPVFAAPALLAALWRARRRDQG